MFVYLIVNDVNEKIYVGKTTSRSLQQYLQKKIYVANHPSTYRSQSHLYAAIRKYGREHFHIYPSSLIVSVTRLFVFGSNL